MYQESVSQVEQIAFPDPQPELRGKSSSLVRCACSDCGAHAYRPLGPDGASPLEPTGAGTTCTVCGANELVPLDQPAPMLAA